MLLGLFKPKPKSGQGKLITNPIQIGKIFLRLQYTNTAIRAVFRGRNQEFLTAIIKVDEKNKLIWFDELTPSNGTDYVKELKKFHIHCKMKGIDVRASIDIDQIKEEEKGFYYRAPFPESVVYLQRREAHRISTEAKEYPVVMIQEEIHIFKGILYDLSVSGFGVRIQVGGATPPPKAKDKLTVRMRIPIGEVSGVAEVCSIKYDPGNERPRLGMRFIDIKSADKKKMVRFITEVQRDMLRKRAKTVG